MKDSTLIIAIGTFFEYLIIAIGIFFALLYLDVLIFIATVLFFIFVDSTTVDAINKLKQKEE